MKKFIKPALLTCLGIIVFGVIVFLGINFYMIQVTKPYIINPDESNVETQAALVLGARVYSDGRLSDMLEDRMVAGLKAYNNNLSDKLLVSGDHGQVEYNEVKAMRQYALDEGVPSEDIFMDHAGFSTYDSVLRASKVFNAKSLIIVTQKYHLTRALYIARKNGIEAYGIVADRYIYPKMPYFQFRESLARIKDFINVHILKPDPTYLGEMIPISGDGNVTQDEK